jgi:hypothetical protein
MSNCNYNAGFENVQDLSSYYLETQLEDNLKSFLDWGFLNIGGFVNVNRPTSNINNTTGFHVLKPQSDPAFGGDSSGKVWETVKKQWVATSGVVYKNISPIQISGVYVNNNFIPGPTGNAQYQYSLDYNLGRVIFNNGLPTNASVQMNYSYKAIQTYKATDTTSNWKELQRYTYLSSDNNKELTSNHRIQMPAIIVEIIPNNNYRPYELGSRTFLASQDIMLHIFTENAIDKQNIVDIVKLQKDRTLLLYDLKKVVKDKVYELNPNGSRNPNSINYQNLLGNSAYFWKYASVEDVRGIDNETVQSNLFYNTTRITVKTVL